MMTLEQMVALVRGSYLIQLLASMLTMKQHRPAVFGQAASGSNMRRDKRSDMRLTHLARTGKRPASILPHSACPSAPGTSSEAPAAGRRCGTCAVAD